MAVGGLVPLYLSGLTALMKNKGVDEARALKVWRAIVPEGWEQISLVQFIDRVRNGSGRPSEVLPHEWSALKEIIAFLETQPRT